MASDYALFAATFPWFFPVVAFFFGACVGSFLNVVIYRVPKGESVVFPGSHCGCGRPIAWHDNIPMLSWLLLRGRARCCGRPFSFRYPAVELLTAVLFLVCWLRYPPLVAVVGALFIACLVAATFIDLDHFIIPDVFTIGLALAGVALSAAVPALHGQTQGTAGENAVAAGLVSLRGLLVGSGLVLWISMLAEAVLRKEAMGFGDVKFVGAIGAFCGWEGAVFAMFGGACVGTVWITLAWLWQKTVGRRSPLTPPTEAPAADDPADEASGPIHENLEAATLLAGVVAVLVAFFLPHLHDSGGQHFIFDSFRSGALALAGLLTGSAVVLWIALLLPFFFKHESLVFCAMRFAGAALAFGPWTRGPAAVALGAALAAGTTAVLWAGLRVLNRRRSAAPDPAEDPASPTPSATPAGPAATAEPAAPAGEPVALGFGVHIPFGPMLAIAGGLHFLLLRDFVGAWFAQFTSIF
jgi:leader peptidase (prepilin peptidase)/N-methyltransferase